MTAVQELLVLCWLLVCHALCGWVETGFSFAKLVNMGRWGRKSSNFRVSLMIVVGNVTVGQKENYAWP